MPRENPQMRADVSGPKLGKNAYIAMLALEDYGYPGSYSITSMHRTKELNDSIPGASPDSLHLDGNAVDIGSQDTDDQDLVRWMNETPEGQKWKEDFNVNYVDETNKPNNAHHHFGFGDVEDTSSIENYNKYEKGYNLNKNEDDVYVSINPDDIDNTLRWSTVSPNISVEETEEETQETGCISGDCQNGQGTYTYASGSKYVGEYKEDKKDGQGTYTWQNPWEQYVGEWKGNKYHGQGSYTLATGEKYIGEWKDGKKHGHGTYTYSSGSKYVGEWKDGNYHGQGTWTGGEGEFEGDKYVGEWKDDYMHGKGTYTYTNAVPGYANGEKYVGEFKDGRKHGKGKNVRNDGNEYVIWHYNGEHITEGSPSISQEFYNREEEDRRAGLSQEERDKEDEKKYKVVLDAEGNEIRIPIGPDVTEQEIEQAQQEEQTGVKTYENWEDVYKDDTLDRSQTIQVGPNTYKWQPDEGAEDDKNAGNYLIVNEQGEFVPYENNETQLIVQTERRNQVLGISDEVVVEEEEGPGIVVKEEVSNVDNGDGTSTITYTDGTTEIITTPVVETPEVETPDITTEDEGPGLMEKIGSGVGATLKGAGTLLDSIGGPSAIISYIMGKEGLKHAMKEIEPQKMPELSPLFHQHLRQTRELAKKGFHPAEARKIRKDIDAAYEQGLDNAVRGTSGDRAKFLAHSGILDSKRSSALLDFATQDAALQRENQDKYVDTMMFKENFEAQRSEKLRAEDMQMQMANKQSAAQFTSAAFSNLMSGLGGGNSSLLRQMMQMYQSGGTGTNDVFNTVNPK